MAISSFSNSGLSRVNQAPNAVINGSPTGSYSSGGITYNYFTFTGNSTLTVNSEGVADVLVVAGGGGSSGGASGGYGGGSLTGTVFLTAGSKTVTIGAGGAGASGANAPSTGSHSLLDTFRAEGASGSTWFNGPGSFFNVTASITSALNNSSTTYASRGASSGSASGAANTGNGGGSSTNSTGGSGGSGIVIVRVAV